jgi:hypothetical protein
MPENVDDSDDPLESDDDADDPLEIMKKMWDAPRNHEKKYGRPSSFGLWLKKLFSQVQDSFSPFHLQNLVEMVAVGVMRAFLLVLSALVSPAFSHGGHTHGPPDPDQEVVCRLTPPQFCTHHQSIMTSPSHGWPRQHP